LVLTSIHRKEWIEHRLQELAQVFAVAVGGFSVLDNHLHLLVRLDPEVAKGWSDEEVVRRWGQLFPPRDNSRQPLPVSNDWIQCRLKDAGWVATARAFAKPELVHHLIVFPGCAARPWALLCDAFGVGHCDHFGVPVPRVRCATLGFVVQRFQRGTLRAFRRSSSQGALRDPGFCCATLSAWDIAIISAFQFPGCAARPWALFSAAAEFDREALHSVFDVCSPRPPGQ